MSDTMSSRILVAEDQGVYLIKLVGDVRVVLCSSLNDYIEAVFCKGDALDVVIDLLDATGADSTTLGLLAKLAIFCNREFNVRPKVFCKDDGIYQSLIIMGLDDIFELIEGEVPSAGEMNELKEGTIDLDVCRRNVLEAHKLLVELNPANSNEFIDLIRTLESQ